MDTDETWKLEDADEIAAGLIEEVRSTGWIVPEWMVGKVREGVVDVITRRLTGKLSLSLEVFGGQVADITVTVSEAPHAS
jgi:hypothetical protein